MFGRVYSLENRFHSLSVAVPMAQAVSLLPFHSSRIYLLALSNEWCLNAGDLMLEKCFGDLDGRATWLADDGIPTTDTSDSVLLLGMSLALDAQLISIMAVVFIVLEHDPNNKG